jgi:hypothetical protein
LRRRRSGPQQVVHHFFQSRDSCFNRGVGHVAFLNRLNFRSFPLPSGHVYDNDSKIAKALRAARSGFSQRQDGVAETRVAAGGLLSRAMLRPPIGGVLKFAYDRQLRPISAAERQTINPAVGF